MNCDVQQSSAAGTDAEVASASATVPIWLIVLMLVLLFLCAWVFDLRGGWFEPKVYGPYTSVTDLGRFQPRQDGDVWKIRGRFLFDQNCAQCHNNDGSGKPGQAPPFVGSEWVLTPGVNRLIRIPQVGLAGPLEVKGQQWNLAMAGMGAPYSDDDLAAVLSYIRNSWGNKASVVTGEQVKKVRAEISNRSQPYTPDELKKLPE